MQMLCQVRLVVADGPNEGDVIPVRFARFLIGRRPGCHFRPSGDGVADTHCALLIRDGCVYMKDLRQAEGASVDRQPVVGVVQLRDGDRFQVGQWHLKVRIARRASPLADPAATPVPSSVASDPRPALAVPAINAGPEPGASPLLAGPSPCLPSAVKRTAKVAPSSGKRIVLVGRKDQATSLLRQQQWEAGAQARTPPSIIAPKRQNRWLQAASVGLVVAFLGALYLAATATAPQAAPATPAAMPRKQRQTTPPDSAERTESRPLPRLDGPPPPRRRAVTPNP